MNHFLDYTFTGIIAVYALYGIFCFWKRFYRINLHTTDDLLELYIKLVKYESRR